MAIQTPAQIFIKFSTHIPTCPRKVLTLDLGGLKLKQLKDAFLKTVYETKDVKQIAN